MATITEPREEVRPETSTLTGQPSLSTSTEERKAILDQRPALTESDAAGAAGIPAAAVADSFERWARTRSVRRDFWIATGVFVAGEGLIGFLALLSGGSGFPLDAQLARSLLSGLLCSWVALAGFALVTRHWLPGYARLTIAAAGVGFPLLVAFIWVSGGGAWSNLHWSAVAILVGLLAVSAQRLWIGAWTDAVVKRIVFAVTAVSITVVVALTVVEIWGSSTPDRLWSFAFLTFIGFVLTPILRRAMRSHA